MECLRYIPSPGMVVLTDVDDAHIIHPTGGETVKNRFAYLALGRTYGKKGFPVTGPLYRSMKVEGNKIILPFDEIDKGLATSRRSFTGFKITGEDRIFHPADARLGEGVRTVVVSDPEVKHPAAIRHAFENYVEGCLFNMSGLPASPFRTDNWQ